LRGVEGGGGGEADTTGRGEADTHYPRTHTRAHACRDVKDKLAPACRAQLFKVQRDAAEDYRADAQLFEVRRHPCCWGGVLKNA
jgi:hypothetical protein